VDAILELRTRVYAVLNASEVEEPTLRNFGGIADLHSAQVRTFVLRAILSGNPLLSAQRSPFPIPSPRAFPDSRKYSCTSGLIVKSPSTQIYLTTLAVETNSKCK